LAHCNFNNLAGPIPSMSEIDQYKTLGAPRIGLKPLQNKARFPLQMKRAATTAALNHHRTGADHSASQYDLVRGSAPFFVEPAALLFPDVSPVTCARACGRSRHRPL